MISYLSVAVGGALGSVARYWLSGVVAARMGETFPAGTLIVNITGCFIAGLFVALTGPDGRLLVSPTFRQFFVIGVCGGYTTFSSFSLQTLTLVQEGEWLSAGLNTLASFTLCMLGVWLGYVAGMTLIQR
jgi:fluoride exporter